MWMAGWCRVEGRAGHSGICGAPHPHASPVPPSPRSRGEGRVRGIALRWRDAVPRQRPHEPRPARDNPLLSDPQTALARPRYRRSNFPIGRPLTVQTRGALRSISQENLTSPRNSAHSELEKVVEIPAPRPCSSRSATSAVDPDGEATVSSRGSAPFRRYPKRQRVEIDRMRLAGGRLRNGRALPRVYVADIDVWRTVKAAAWIRSGASIGSP